MDHADAPVGRLLSRREILGLFGAATGGLLTAGVALACRSQPPLSSFPSCVARPEQTEGPYFVNEELRRSDIRADPDTAEIRAGVPLAIAFAVSQITEGGCEPLPNAQVDVWQCDAFGVYAGVADRRFDTRGQKFLRGYQVTDDRGRAAFTTIYPGWYPGRTVHIHFKIRTFAGQGDGVEFTSQLYFDDDLTDRIHANDPYAERGSRTVRNRDDGIFRRGGDQLLVHPTATSNGYEGTFSLGLLLD